MKFKGIDYEFGPINDYHIFPYDGDVFGISLEDGEYLNGVWWNWNMISMDGVYYDDEIDMFNRVVAVCGGLKRCFANNDIITITQTKNDLYVVMYSDYSGYNEDDVCKHIRVYLSNSAFLKDFPALATAVSIMITLKGLLCPPRQKNS